MGGTRVLVCAIAAADWTRIHPAIDGGALPHLHSLIKRGASGFLAAAPPLSVPLVTTTLATGRHPENHGVLADAEARPDGGGVQPIGRRSWRAPALWELAAAAGLRTAAVNWPATVPARLWPGIVVDDDFAEPHGRDFAGWPLPPGCVSPATWRPTLADLRVHPTEIGAAELATLLPRLAGMDRRRDRRPARLAAALARAATVHAATTHLAEAAAWDLLVVRHTLLTDVWRALAPDGDARAGGADAAVHDDAIAGAYRLLDVMLGRLLELAGPQATVLVAAPSGWRTAGPLTRQASDPEAMAPRDQGVLIAAGPGIRADAVLHGARAADVCPTVLALFGLAAPSDGAVIRSLFAAGPPALAPVPPITDPDRPAAEAADPAAHLLALGYRDRLTAAQVQALAGAEMAALRNRGDALIARRNWPAAVDALEALLGRAPGDYLATLKLGRVLLNCGETARARTLAEAAIAAVPEQPWGDLLMGTLLAMQGDAAAAGPHLARAREAGGEDPSVRLRLGWIGVLLRRWSDAEAAFRAVLAWDDSVAEAHAGLGIALHGLAHDGPAEAALRRAVGLVFDNPAAHFHLGQILAARGALAEAAGTLRTALAQAPAMPAARALLDSIERGRAQAIAGRALAGQAPRRPADYQRICFFRTPRSNQPF